MCPSVSAFLLTDSKKTCCVCTCTEILTISVSHDSLIWRCYPKCSLKWIVRFLIAWNNTSVGAHLHIEVTCMSPSSTPWGLPQWHSSHLFHKLRQKIPTLAQMQSFLRAGTGKCQDVCEDTGRNNGGTVVRTFLSIPFVLGSPRLRTDATNCTHVGVPSELQLTLK